MPLPRARYGHCYPVPSAVTQCHYYPVLLPSARYRSRYPVPFPVLAGPGGGGAVRGRGRAGRAGARRGQSGGGAERREPPGAAGSRGSSGAAAAAAAAGGQGRERGAVIAAGTAPHRTEPDRAERARTPSAFRSRAGRGAAEPGRSGPVRSALWVFRNPGRAQLGRARSSAGTRLGPRAPGRAEATVGPLRGGGGHVPGPSWCRGASRGGGAPAPPEPGRFSHAGPGGRGGRLRVPVPGRGEDPGQRGASRAVRGGPAAGSAPNRDGGSASPAAVGGTRGAGGIVPRRERRHRGARWPFTQLGRGRCRGARGSLGHLSGGLRSCQGCVPGQPRASARPAPAAPGLQCSARTDGLGLLARSVLRAGHPVAPGR